MREAMLETASTALLSAELAASTAELAAELAASAPCASARDAARPPAPTAKPLLGRRKMEQLLRAVLHEDQSGHDAEKAQHPGRIFRQGRGHRDWPVVSGSCVARAARARQPANAKLSGRDQAPSEITVRFACRPAMRGFLRRFIAFAGFCAIS